MAEGPAAQVWSREEVHGRGRCPQRERSCSQPCWDDIVKSMNSRYILWNLARAWRLLGLGPDPKGLLSFHVQTLPHIWLWVLSPYSNLSQFYQSVDTLFKGTAVENKILHLGKVMRRYPHLLSFFPRGLVQGKISLRKNKRTSGSRSHKSFLCSFVLPLYPPNIKSLPFRLIAEWLRLPEEFKVSQE